MISTQTTSGQSQRWDCLPLDLLLAYCPEEQAESFPVSGGVYGKTIQAAFLNPRTGQPRRRTSIHLKPDTSLILFKSEYEHWYYICQLSQLHQQYGCSCEEGVIYSRTRQECEHMRQLAKAVKS